MHKIKELLDKKSFRIPLLMVCDVISILVASLFAILLRYDFGSVPSIYMVNSYKYIIVDFVILFAIFMYLKLYTLTLKYVSVTEFIDILIGCFSFEAITFIYKSAFNIQLPRSCYLIQLLLLSLFVCISRSFYRVARAIVIKIKDTKKDNNTMIIGAGTASRLLIDEIYNNPSDFNNRVVCIIDDNKQKKGTYIKGIPVVGNREEISRNCNKYNIKEIIIAIPSLSKSKLAAIVEECQKTKCIVKILPSINDMIGSYDSDKNIVKKIRPLSYEDFLGRDQIIVNGSEIEESLTNKTVMVTGGGGSIGSELCRQIAQANPKRLIIFDIYENNAYDIEQELLRTYPQLNLKTIIGSVRDYDRLEKVFREYDIDIIFHAAAHKHVPLMEVSPNEAIKNNCLGTLNVTKLADKYKVKKFVLISTDKAVRPTNVMGASKRICEMIIQMYAKKSKNTDYAAVRFGNVLGSNGSVIPLFIKQIENGGPVTVTHKDITRFFMTIPEAVSLVLQASVYAKHGEIFVLDMGKPVKIYDLAKQIIKYKGFEPEKDIKIEITGLRPGEKLYEEILMEEEGLKETPNKLIHIGSPIKFDEDKFSKELDDLIKAAYENKDDIKERLAKVVDTYKIDSRK